MGQPRREDDATLFARSGVWTFLKQGGPILTRLEREGATMLLEARLWVGIPGSHAGFQSDRASLYNFLRL